MMASNTTAYYHLLKVALLLSTIICLIIHRAACFSPQKAWRIDRHRINNNNNLHPSHQSLDHHFTTKATTALSVSLQESAADRHHQWQHHKSYNTKDENEILHGRYTAVITSTTDLTNRWIGSFDTSAPLDTSITTSTASQSIQTANGNDISEPPPIEALQAIQATHRWADNFVRQLHLCPWAGSSLDKAGAICYWALLVNNDQEDDERVVLDKMEEIVREAGIQLTLATSDDNEDEEDGEGGGRIDPSVAISFIVLVPMKQSTNDSNDINSNGHALPDFGTFHEFFIDLEDRLLDECDDYWDLIDDATNEHDNTKSDNDKDNKDDETTDITTVPNGNSLGCDITIAAFHPKWQFNGSDGDAAIDYEKRTPYPTVSIVMSSVIESLLKEREDEDGDDDGGGGSSASALATERIADLNEKTLCAIGVERLKEMFDEEVLGCPMKGQS